MKARYGFTLIETLVAVVVAGVLAAVAFSGFGGVQERLGVRSARAAFLSSHAQARAYAVERGTLVRLVADSGSDEVSVEIGCDGLGDTLESVDLEESFAVNIELEAGELSLCMTPKGIANPTLNSFGNEVTVEFVRGSASSSVVLLPLGQVVVP
jgi:prepilin-type N-terminal cleavage/methylation domain-containing protein